MNNVLIYILLGFCIISISLLFVFLKEILNCFSDTCKALREFIVENTGFFTILFLSIFFLEQILLLYVVYSFDVPLKAQLFIGILALVVITTATLQKFVWEYKFQNVKQILYKTSIKNKEYWVYAKKAISEYSALLDKQEKMKLKKKR